MLRPTYHSRPASAYEFVFNALIPVTATPPSSPSPSIEECAGIDGDGEDGGVAVTGIKALNTNSYADA
jgi:hypothetical protein